MKRAPAHAAQRGMTVIESLGALAIAALLLLGLTRMVDAALDDAEGQQAALQQQQVSEAAKRYLTANYAALTAGTAGGAVATVTTAQLQAGQFLPAGFAATNTYRQGWCVLVRQPAPGRLDALVASHGGRAIPDRDLAAVALLAGQGGGYISAAAPDTARGASWQLATTDYRNVACGGVTVLTGAAADGGHLVTGLFYDGPGQLSTDFLYRAAVPGRPELNQMSVPLHMLAQAAENDAGDPRCTAGGSGKIAMDAGGRVLSCQAGVWRRQGAGYWKDPVAAYADLPVADNNVGDVRLVSGLRRAFAWDGAAWQALAVDQDGNLLAPGDARAGMLKLTQTVTANAACADNGALARDAAGLALSCEAGRWRNPLTFRLGTLVYDTQWTVHYGDGQAVDLWIDVTALPGPRPLYLTGYALCHATGFPRAYAYVNMVDDVAGPGFIAGGCMSRPDNPGASALGKGVFGLQEIPDNVTRLYVHREVEIGSSPDDYIQLAIKIYNSE
ncbi:shufflon system plasmid conjugative transfer pilus tip adhesin PilV [Duganella radicis]|uniref:Shufflon system plasmid conjugative transfer pilus tip adhesin PilV n=1 Tax=Duganella radicis TaxID=551988 RepID=A0A6L6PRR3_9BURK|nr:shufflon system plasmid conjugative transfer pilus tip adhesin PilV [Duganella radicis]MTV41730.1 shufflon system plasmid conjugative transfer pilus tip adhesin PilV [Duganella radicis]